MNRSDFQQLSRLRLKEAAALLRAEHYPGSYYLGGCAIECALKACIAKQTRRHDFPEVKPVLELWTHNLEGLVKVAGLWADLLSEVRSNEIFAVNWAVTKDWAIDSKYDQTTEGALARDLYSAISSRKNGVLPWMQERW